MASSSIAKVLAILIVIGLVLAGLYFYFVDPYMSRLLQARVGDFMTKNSLPEDLGGAAYLLSPLNGGGVYADGELDYSEYAADGSITMELASASGVEAKIVYRQYTSLIDVVADGTVLLSSNELKRSLAVSPDGTKVAVAVCKERDRQAPIDCWHVVVIDINSKESSTLGAAVATTFLDDGTVLALNPNGGFAVDIASRSSSSLFSDIPPFISTATYLARSEDGSLLAWAEQIGPLSFDAAAVYAISRDPSWKAEKIASFRGITGPVALTNENMYEIAYEDGKSVLAQHPLDGSPERTVRVFPSILSLAQLIP
jgi:hypothetical protein